MHDMQDLALEMLTDEKMAVDQTDKTVRKELFTKRTANMLVRGPMRI